MAWEDGLTESFYGDFNNQIYCTGIEGSSRAYASMQAERVFLRARAVIKLQCCEQRALFPMIHTEGPNGTNCWTAELKNDKPRDKDGNLFVLMKSWLIWTTTKRAGFNENPSMRAGVKILRAWLARELSSNVCEQFEQRSNFASAFKLNGTIRYP